MSDGEPTLLSEQLRPKTFRELSLPGHHIAALQAMQDGWDIHNMLFLGPPGTGKTSAARVFLATDGFQDGLTVDGSVDTGIDNIRKLVEGFASTVPFAVGPKLCFIDEADHLSRAAQASLRGIIERTHRNCRFIFAANDGNKIDPALRSRLLPIYFGVSGSERSAFLLALQERMHDRLSALGRPLDSALLERLISTSSSDLRNLVNKIAFELSRAA